MEVKAILSDLDGTLIDFNGHYHTPVPSLIKKLQQKNIQFALATGKAFFGQVERIVRELDLSPLNIVSGGGMIYNWKTKETPWYRPISSRSTQIVAEYMKKNGLIFSLETKSDVYMLEIVEAPVYTKDMIIKQFSLSSVPTQVLKILIHTRTNKLPEKAIDSHIKNLKNMCKDIEIMKISIHGCYGLDVTSQESTKHTAVLEYAKILGISPQHIVAIGDGHNDYPLFTACGYRIAMDNAPKELKEISDRAVKTSLEGGMVEALSHILDIL